MCRLLFVVSWLLFDVVAVVRCLLLLFVAGCALLVVRCLLMFVSYCLLIVDVLCCLSFVIC